MFGGTCKKGNEEMRSKILFSDLDATLLCDDKSISEKNRNAIQKMLKQGHYFVVATGRPVESGRKVVKELGLTMPGCYMIAFNGAVIYDCSADRILFKKSVPIEVVQEIFEKANKAGIYVQTYNDVDIITKKRTKELEFYVKRTHMTYKLSEKILDALKGEPQKVMLIRLQKDGKLEKFQAQNRQWETGRCHSFFSCKEYLEYVPENVDKGTGIDYLTKLLDLPNISTVAVGDEQNDIPMIKKAHVGIAVKNATDAAKAAADYVTENDNNHDALAEVIGRFVL